MSEFRIKAGDIVQHVSEPSWPYVVVPWKHPSNGLFGTIECTEDGFFEGEFDGPYNDRGERVFNDGRVSHKSLEPYQELAPKEVWRAELKKDHWPEPLALFWADRGELEDHIKLHSPATAKITKYVRAEE